jgi:hypothetical protein
MLESMAEAAIKPWCTISIGKFQVKIDKEDKARVTEKAWRVTEGTTGRKRVVTSIRMGAKVQTLTLGRFLMNPKKGKQVYPRRFNADLDYRKSNLIVCTLSERQRLLPKNRKTGTSIYRGVSFSKRDKKWRAAIEVDGRSFNLGLYSTEAEAAEVYNKAAKKHFGQIAYQNQILRSRKERRT